MDTTLLVRPTQAPHLITVNMVDEARERLRSVLLKRTPIQLNSVLSERYEARVHLKREDLLPDVRSYKLRGAYNRMACLSDAERERGIVGASAGNHAQGVAWSCKQRQVHGVIVMPRNTPRQKVDRVGRLGNSWVDVCLVGDSYDEACAEAELIVRREGKTFIHAFNDPLVIAGQGTVGVEIYDQLVTAPDIVVVPVGGGGLIAGLGSYLKAKWPSTKIVGVEALGAAGMYESLRAKKVVTLGELDTFVEGAAVRKVGDVSFAAAQTVVDAMVVVDPGKVCQEMIGLYQNDGIVAEPAGALTVAALDQLGDLRGKTVVCVVSGGNNDISRYPEVIERSLIYQGLKHYFMMNFSQRPGALRRLLDEALGPTDDITLFEYVKKNNRENGPALVGIELAKKDDLMPLLGRMDAIGMSYERLAHDSSVFRYLI